MGIVMDVRSAICFRFFYVLDFLSCTIKSEMGPGAIFRTIIRKVQYPDGLLQVVISRWRFFFASFVTSFNLAYRK